MTTRIYRVDDGGETLLVRASNQAQAVHHIAKRIKVRVATQDDLVKLAGMGTEVQVANGHGKSAAPVEELGEDGE